MSLMGTMNTLNGIWGANNLVAKLTGNKSFKTNDGYSPSVWGSGLGAQQVLMVKTNIGGYLVPYKCKRKSMLLDSRTYFFQV